MLSCANIFSNTKLKLAVAQNIFEKRNEKQAGANMFDSKCFL